MSDNISYKHVVYLFVCLFYVISYKIILKCSDNFIKLRAIKDNM